MSISNKFGPMVVTTGSKSEMSVGYATLYGDMNGGYNPVKDLYKMEVYRLSALRNRWRPAGALGPDGVDPGEHHRQGADGGAAREPEGPGLAAALRGARRHPRMPRRARDAGLGEVVARGHDLETVKKIERLLYLAEYKRRQRAGRQGDAQELRPRPPLSDRQPLPRPGPGRVQGRRGAGEQRRGRRGARLTRPEPRPPRSMATRSSRRRSGS